MTTRRGLVGGLTAAAAVLASGRSSFATPDYPTKQVKVIAPFAPGAATDTCARIVAQRLGERWGKPVATWQVSLVDGTHVYINRGSGEIEAVRTRWWRFYDVMWGLHIMDLQTREDAHNPFVVVFALIALIGALLGTVLLFRRRRARVGI